MERPEKEQKEERVNCMKIGVVTNFDTKNYGSLLQAFALQKKLEELGSDPYILQKKATGKRSLGARAKKFLFRSGNNYSLKDKAEIKRAKKAFSIKNRKLQSFVNENIDVRVCSPKSAHLVVGDTDVMIAGSDQIWSSSAGTLSEFTTLQFVPDRIKRYAFAASLGTIELNEESKNLLRNGLEHFSEVTVRENSAVSLIKDITSVPVNTVLDPTFLYDTGYWSVIAKEPEVDENYIFVYMLRPEPVTLSAALALADKTGYKVYLFSNRLINDSRVKNITDAGLEEFLGYIKNADYVVTNSFHGTAFSIQFKKQFLSIAISGSGMRVTDFLELIGAQDRIITSADQIDMINDEIDWSHIEDVIQAERKRSIEYLNRIISDSATDTAVNDAREKSIPLLYRDETECCACAACANICPKSAISMKPNKYGSLYPSIDATLCVGCGSCKKVCNYQNGYKKGDVLATYGAVASAERTRISSASGGIFAAIAESVIDQGGYVYGCSMESVGGKLSPVHVEISDLSDLHKLQKSKYAQSSINLIYRQVKTRLQTGEKVLFSGTACQISGLIGYLGNREYQNLFTIDIICHGVPGASILQDYISFIEKKKNMIISAIDFRDKTYGWGVKGTITGHNAGREKKLYFDSFNSSFYNLYLKAGFYRDNCYSCPYANTQRPGDITLGDFWGVDVQHPEWLSSVWNKNQGISCILVNTEQGKKLLEYFGENMDMKPCTLDEITAKNKMLVRPSNVYPAREEILRIYGDEGYEALDRWFHKKYGLHNFIYGTWDSIPVEKRNQIKKLKRLIKR